MSGFNIRLAETNEKDLISCTAAAVYSEFNLAFDASGKDKDLSNLENYYAAGKGEFWIIESNKSIGGGIGFTKDPAGGLQIKRFFLSPGWRELGISRMLCEKATGFARENSLKTIWIIIPDEFSPSLEKLKGLGFKEDAPPRNVVLPEASTYMKM